jgi:GNAT superfamily N-acetyltransferase
MSALPEAYELQEGADAVAAHAFLTSSYWANGIDLPTVRRSLEGSMQLSIWHKGQQVAMAKVISDFVTFAYLNDVYVLDEHRGKGLSKALISALLAHPRLQTISRWALFTKDAQGLYEKFGWRQYPYPERLMVIDPKLFAA